MVVVKDRLGILIDESLSSGVIKIFFARAQALLQYLFRAVALAFKYDKGWSLLSRLRLTLLSKSINPKILTCGDGRNERRTPNAER